jgi:hypothetical protein
MINHGRGGKISPTPPSNLSTRHDASRPSTVHAPKARCMPSRPAPLLTTPLAEAEKKEREAPREGRVHALEKTRHARNKHRRVPKHDVCARNHHSHAPQPPKHKRKERKRRQESGKKRWEVYTQKRPPVEKEVKNARPTCANTSAAASALAKLSTAYPALFPPMPLEFAFAAFDENPPLPPFP